MRVFNAALTLLFCFPIIAFAQDKIKTDRPGETESTSIIPVNRFQLEAGFQHQQENSDRQFAIPTVLWRYGVAPELELRVITEIAREETEEESLSGLQPVKIGLKWNINHGEGAVPEISLLAHVAVPTLASKDFEEQHLAPEVRLLFKNKIDSKIDIEYNVGTQWDGTAQEASFVYTFSPNIRLSEKFCLFVEEYAFLQPHHYTDHWVDAGVQFLLTKNIQLDVAGGYELSSHNHYHQFFETVGVSLRI